MNDARHALTRWGFLWGFPMIFLSLATNLWATSRTFTSVPGPEHLLFLIVVDACVWPALLGGIGRQGRPMAPPRPIPAWVTGRHP